MKGTGLMIAVVAVLASAPASGQAPPPPAATATATSPRKQFGADADVAVPVGGFSDGVGVGLGALLRYETVRWSRVSLTGRAGFIYHLPKSKEVQGSSIDMTFRTIPILFGIKVRLNDNIYLAAEIGLCLNHAGASAGGAPELSDDTTDWGATVGAGYRRGALDGRLGLRIVDLANAGKTTAVGASVGYSFW